METLLEMGFDETYSEYALGLNNNNVELAIDYMTKNKAPKEIYLKKEKIVLKDDDLFDKTYSIRATEEIFSEKEDAIVYVNCAGHEFATMLSTLLLAKGTKFYRMILDKEAEKYKGMIFIDRPSEYFEVILDTLRYGGDPLVRSRTDNESFLVGLRNEIKFFGLDKVFKNLDLKDNIPGSITKGWKWNPNSSDILVNIVKGKTPCWTLNKIGGSGAWGTHCVAEKPLNSGKHYFEISIDHIESDKSGTVFGLTHDPNITCGMAGGMYGGVTGNPLYGNNGDKVGILIDFNKGSVEFYLQNTYYASAPIKKGTDYWPIVHIYYVGNHFSVSYPKK